jgi:hypothetical protein
MKSMWCAIVGHRPARLKGSNAPLVSVATNESGLEIRIDYCLRCGCIVGSVRDLEIGVVERVEILERQR